MSYNLLFDTEFKNITNTWEYINCKKENKYLISNNKVFGIKQKIILADLTKLYLRCKYNILDSKVIQMYIGVEVNNKLYINKQWSKKNKERLISLVEDSLDKVITVHIIFESEEDINKVYIKEPLLYDLDRAHKNYWLKWLLDKTIKYRYGYEYKNILNYTQVIPSIFNLDKAKIGSIISTKDKKSFKIEAKLIRDKIYLLKLDYTSINDIGKIYLSYGMLKSKCFNNEQEILLFKARDDLDLYLNIEGNDVLPYQINLKHLMLINMNEVSIDKEDIAYLPFI